MKIILFTLGVAALISLIFPGGILTAVLLESLGLRTHSVTFASLLYVVGNFLLGLLVACVLVYFQKKHLAFPTPMPGGIAITAGLLLIALAQLATFGAVQFLASMGVSAGMVVLLLYGTKIVAYTVIAVGVIRAFRSTLQRT